MPPKAASTGSGSTFTAAEDKLIKAIFSNIIGQPQVNWEAVAASAEMKNAQVAKDRYRQVCKKHGFSYSAPPAAASSPINPSKVTKSAKKTVGKKKAIKAKKAKEQSDTDEPEEAQVESDDAEDAKAALQDSDEESLETH